MSQPKESGSDHCLPFDQLSSSDFEMLCFWLAKREGFTDVEHIGAGGADRGRDLLAKKGDRAVAFQCKRYRDFHPRDAKVAIEKILRQMKGEELPDEIVLVVPCNLTEPTRIAARGAAGQRLITFWDKSFLDERVRMYPEIQTRFFQRDYPQKGKNEPTGLILEDLGVESPLWNLSKHYLQFTLSRKGTGTVWVDRISIEVAEAKHLEQLHAPREGEITQIHQDSIRLSVNESSYLLFSGRFFHYRDSKPDVFRVELTSDEGFEYRLQAKVEWHVLGQSNTAAVATTEFHTVLFPIVSDAGALDLLKRKTASQ